ncbi:nuclear protein MDM1 isoform X2 [Chaetodon trifascialis]|uniref:nuclear protein MDM1 isoform X2 n=1 Tax=Chaetodon trifascialis TaxID=109706 RepID=UPI003994F84D
MTVRFKCQSEYQRSYRVSRSRSVSPQRCTPLAGLRSDQMGVTREPGLQRRKKLSPGGPAQSCGSLFCPADPQRAVPEPSPRAHRTAPPAACRSRSAHRKEPKPPTPPGVSADPGLPAEPETPAGPRPAADPGLSVEPRPAGKSVKPHPSKTDSQPQLSQPVTAAPNGQQPSANEESQNVHHALRWRAGLRSAGQRSGGQRSEYHREFSWKKPAAAASPILTAEQVLHSSSRSVPPFKKNPISVTTEYRQSFQGLAPPTKPRLRKHLEHQRVPLFHAHMTSKKRREEFEKKPHPNQEVPTSQEDAMPPPALPQVRRGHRIPEEGGAADGDAPQVEELRRQALLYRRRGWGTNFSRDHLSQLLSEHNALWEPTDTTDSATDPTPRLTSDLCRATDDRSASCVEALDLSSRSSNSSYSSKRSSVAASGETHHTNKTTQTKAPQSPPAGRRTAWGEEEEEEEERSDEEEGRLPTPKLKMLPVQRTHHDLTTPATGGAVLVGRLRSSDEASPSKQRSGSAVSMAAGAETAASVPVKQREAWPENNSHRSSSGSSPNHKPAASPSSKPIRTKQTPSLPVAPPPLIPPPHCIQGTLRHPDFQHNGELGLRLKERQCSGGGCGSDEDDRLSVMSWRSAASCSVASAVLERAQKRRENFWGKR